METKFILSAASAPVRPGLYLLLTMHTQDGGHMYSAFIYCVDCACGIIEGAV